MPRLLFITRKWSPAVGGMESYSIELAASLSEKFDVKLLVLPGKPNGDAPGLAAYGLFTLKAMLFCLLRGRHYKRVIFGDLILFPAAVCHALVAPSARRLVIVFGLDLVYQTRHGLLPLAYRLFFALFRSSQGIFSKVVAISRHTAALATAAGLRNIAVIVPSLPSGGLADTLPATTESLPSTWRSASKRILYFGRLIPRKGSAWYAENIVPKLPTDSAFFVVGASSNTAYKARLGRCARTHLLGRIGNAELAAMIQDADAVVMPNIATPEAVDAEGFGLAAIEASALGGWLLGARLEGITDAIADGVTGYLLESENVEAWTQGSLLALQTSAEITMARREKARSATRTIYSRSNQAEAFLRLLALNSQ